jgi:hypothetical protein
MQYLDELGHSREFFILLSTTFNGNNLGEQFLDHKDLEEQSPNIMV